MKKSSKIYLVGGAIRDELLGREIKDRDYLVVGSSVKDMKANGFHQVGAKFPVFLHPKTKEEYALARREKKSGPGYKGFEFEWDNVSLEEDLKRRDLTINAMARAIDGDEIIDLFNGIEDLKNKRLQHIGAHFTEDPLRVLRVARFLASLDGFQVTTQTKLLCQKMAKNNELAQLTAERVWMETQKALMAEKPSLYFEFLHDIDAFYIFQPIAGFNMEALKDICRETQEIDLRFASLFIADKLLEIDVANVEVLCQKLVIPKNLKKLCLFVAKYSSVFNSKNQISVDDIYSIVMESGALNDQELLEKFLFLIEREHQSPSHYFLKLIHYLKEIDMEKILGEAAPNEKGTLAKKTLLNAIGKFNENYET